MSIDAALDKILQNAQLTPGYCDQLVAKGKPKSLSKQNNRATSFEMVCGLNNRESSPFQTNHNHWLLNNTPLLNGLMSFTAHPNVSAIDAKRWDHLLHGIYTEAEALLPSRLPRNYVVSSLIPNQKNGLECWAEFFKRYDQQLRNKAIHWVPGYSLAFIYALIEGLISAIGAGCLLYVGVHSVPVVCVGAIALGALSFYTNFDFGKKALTDWFAERASAWQDMRSGDEKSIWKKNRAAITGSVFLVSAAAVLMGVIHYATINQNFANFVSLFKKNAIIGGSLPYVAAAIVSVVILVELMMFVHACLKFFQEGGPVSVFKRAAENAFKDKDGKTKWLAAAVFVVVVLCNIVGISFLISGSVGTINDIYKLQTQALAWASAIVGGIGLVFFFIKSALGCAARIDGAFVEMKSKEWAEHKAYLKTSLVMNWAAIAGVLAFCVCASTPVGWAMGLTVFLCSLSVNYFWRKGYVYVTDKKSDPLVDVARVANGAGVGTMVAISSTSAVQSVIGGAGMFVTSNANCMPTSLQSRCVIKQKGLYNSLEGPSASPTL